MTLVYLGFLSFVFLIVSLTVANVCRCLETEEVVKEVAKLGGREVDVVSLDLYIPPDSIDLSYSAI